jgi:hypothetical protein
MTTVTTKVKAWIGPHSSVSPADLIAGKRIEDLYFSGLNMTSAGWTTVGEAEITVHLVDEKAMVENKVEALREEAKAIRAEAHMKCTIIEEQIQNLLAITYEPTPTGQD